MNSRNEWTYTLAEVESSYESGYHRGYADAGIKGDCIQWRAVAVRNTIIGFLLVAMAVLTWGVASCRG